MIRLHMTFIFLGVMVSCSKFSSKNSTEQSEYSLANSFGSRPKVKVAHPLDYPYSAIGRVGNGCVATLVGRSLAVTAGHCAVDEGTGEIRKEFRYFIPNSEGQDLEPVYIDKFWYAVAKPGHEERGKDWAILHLVKPIGDQLQWMLVDGIDIARQLPYTVNVSGYSADFHGGQLLYEYSDCMILEVSPNPKDEGNLYHNCSTGLGTSGAPLFFKRERGVYLDAIHVSEKRKNSPSSLNLPKYSFEYANVAIGAKQFKLTLETLRSKPDEGASTIDVVFPGNFIGKNPPQAETEKILNGVAGNPQPNPGLRSNLVSQEVFMQRLSAIETHMRNISRLSAECHSAREYKTAEQVNIVVEIHQDAFDAVANLEVLRRSGLFHLEPATRVLAAYRGIYDKREILAGKKKTARLNEIGNNLEKIRALLVEESTQKGR